MINARFLAFFSFIGVITSIALIFILGFLQQGYSILRNTVSVLGAEGGANALLMNALVFPLLGSSVTSLGLALKIMKKGLVGPILLMISGFSTIMIGLFPCTNACLGFDFFHELFANTAFLSIIISQFAFYYSLSNWKRYANYSLINGLSAIIILTFLIFNLSLKGLFQRLLMGLPLIWVIVLSVKLMR